jgi:hypothetical protein
MAEPKRGGGVHIPKPFNFKEVRSKGRLDDLLETTKRRSDPKFYDNRTLKFMKHLLEN